eukprot:4718319-Amphidinium_carterae.1
MHMVQRACDGTELVPQPDISADLSELRREGIKVASLEAGATSTTRSSALLFEGARRVHTLLDVLRQLFLGAPLCEAPSSRPRLPRLLAPTAFRHARQ